MALTNYGWNDFFARALDSLIPGLSPARVAAECRGHYTLWTTVGEVTAHLPVRWHGDIPVAGDWVAIRTVTGNAICHALLPRRTKVSRKRAGRGWEEQVLAANVEVLFLVTGMDGDFNLRRLERYLVLARESGARAVIVLNKSDLCTDLVEKLRLTRSVAPDVPVIVSNAVDLGATGQLKAQFSGYVEPAETAVLLGSSGAGKSTIANALLGRQAQSVLPVRLPDNRGRHSTTGRQMFLLDSGWLLIDTPGLRELEPWASADSAAAVFPDVQEAAAMCRFRDCRHQGEPGCGVAAALVRGDLLQERVESFAKLQREMEYLDRMADSNATREHKRKWKQINKAMRHFSKDTRFP